MMKLFNFKSIIFGGGVLFAAAYIPGALAICTWTGAHQSITISMGDITVQRDAPIGSTIATAVAPTVPGAAYASCNVGKTSYLMQYGAAVSGVAHTYRTNLPGVGIQLVDSGNVYFENPASSISWGTVGLYYGRTYTATLIKTGAITPGALAAATIGQGYVENDPSTVFLDVLMGAGNIRVAACSIKTPTVNVALGDYFTTEFTSVGHTTASRPVNIVLDCGTDTRINAVVTANADTSQQGTMKLTAGTGTATGVGVQLLNSNNNPVALNSKFVVDTTTADGQYTINWSARYIQTASSVTTGQANATATLTLTYE